MLKRLFGNTTRIVLGLCVLTISCGKKPGSDKRGGEVVTPPLEQSQVEQLLATQEVVCDSNQACPNYLSKIVVVNNNKLQYCTGFLVEEDVVATSTSCLPTFLRRNTQDCSRDVFFFFPRTANRPAERVDCSQVVQVSQLEGSDPVLWRDDVSFLKLKKKLTYRRQASVSRDGVSSNKDYTAWLVDQVDASTAIIRRSTCTALHGTYINPLAVNDSSPNLVFADCGFKETNSGSPVLDSKGRVRAIISTGISTKLRDYLGSTGLLLKPLREMVHATNFACAPTLENSDVLDERECFKDMRYSKVDDLRAAMLSTTALFSEMRAKFEESLEAKSPYLRFGVKMIPKGDIQETEIYPKCFKPLSAWLATLSGTRNNYVFEISLPFKSFRRAMDANGRIQGVIQDMPVRKYFMQFSMKSLRSNKTSTVFMWNDSENRTYQNMNETCAPSTMP